MRRLRQHANSMAEQKRQFIDSLPDDAGGQIRELTEYDFLDPEAQAEFNDLLDKLRRQVMDSYFKNLSETIENLTPEDIERMRQMLQELNEMIEQRMQGREPDFDSFMEKYGDFFEGMKPTSLDDLIEKLQRQMAMQQSLLDSLPQDSRRSLQDMLNSKIMDPRLRGQMAQLGQNLEALFPMRQMRRQYPFHGAEQLSFEQAMQVMDQLQQIDDLEKQMEHTRMGADLDNVDVDKLRDILGDEAAQNLEDLKDLTKLLEEAGYIQRDGEQFELTPRGMRRIGQRALQDILHQTQQRSVRQPHARALGTRNRPRRRQQTLRIRRSFHHRPGKDDLQRREPARSLRTNQARSRRLRGRADRASHRHLHRAHARSLLVDGAAGQFPSGQENRARAEQPDQESVPPRPDLHRRILRLRPRVESGWTAFSQLTRGRLRNQHATWFHRGPEAVGASQIEQ